MTDRRTGASLARLGLTEPRAEAILDELGWWSGDGPASGAEPVMWALARSPDPDLALRSAERLMQSAVDRTALDAALRTDTSLRGRLLALLGSSTALGDHLVAHPDRWHRLTGDAPLPCGYTPVLLRAVGADPDAPPPGSPGGARAALTAAAAVTALRCAYRDELLVLAGADLAAVGEPELPVLELDDVAARLADLAAAALRAALAVAAAESGETDTAARLAVIAMGKCGGRELNYVSDVDVVFLAEPADQATTRLASRMMRIASDACFEVDANLRPEGRQGALVRTLDGHLSYYKRWAKTWEFQALLKARPIAGDSDLGAAYAEAVAPLVWNAAGREDFVADVQAMRRRVEDHVHPDHAERELKLGRGGLRDVEFAVQLLQLVHGRTDESLRRAPTLDALAALAAGGYVAREDGANLAASYRFLRLLEHRLQLQRMRRTHLLPAADDIDALRWLGRAARLRPDGRHDVVGVLLAEWNRNAHRVRRLHQKLFYRPLLTAVSRLPADTARLSESAATARLRALGWASPEGALGHLRALTGGVSRAASIQQTLLPVLLDELTASPDPDRGLLAYRRVSEALAQTPWYLRLLRDEGEAAEQLAGVLTASPYAADLLLGAPDSVGMLGADAELVPRPREVLLREMTSAARRHGDPVAAIAAVRSMRRRELCRIAVADVLGRLGPDDVGPALTDVALATLTGALEAATGAVGAELRTGVPVRMAVVAMGRLGGHEIGYASDADVMFVHVPVSGTPEQRSAEAAHAVAQEMRRMLAAPGDAPPLQLDAGLRPEGRQGPLVRSLASYAAYYARWSQPWEIQALLRADPVVGDEEVAERFRVLVDPLRWPVDGLSDVAATEIRRVKARVDAERLPRGADPALHLKLGPGGLADVEWTVQLLQLRHAAAIPALRTTATVPALTAAAEAGLMGTADAAALAAAWQLAQRLRNTIVLAGGRTADVLPGDSRERAAIAYLIGRGADGFEAVADEWRRTARRARAVVDRVFWA